MSDEQYQRKRELLGGEIADELVVLDPESGECFGLNPVAATVWKLLDQPKNADQLRSALLEHYDVSAKRCSEELRDLLADMATKGLIEMAG